MKNFFGSLFIEKSMLKEAGINFEIKLEYYKISETHKNKTMYGVEVIVTEYRKEKTYVETKEAKEIFESEEEIEYLLKLLKDNIVTPTCLDDVIEDYIKENYSLEKIACS